MKECRYPGLLYSLLEERVGTDLEIVCKDGSFSCHAVMLAVSEQWWRNLLEPSEQSIGTFKFKIRHFTKVLRAFSLFIMEKSLFFATNSNFLMPISFDPKS